MRSSEISTIANMVAEHPSFAIAISVSLQALVIAAVAALAIKLCRRDAIWMHRIWTMAVILLLLIIPLHFGSLTRVVSIPNIKSRALKRYDSQPTKAIIPADVRLSDEAPISTNSDAYTVIDDYQFEIPGEDINPSIIQSADISAVVSGETTTSINVNWPVIALALYGLGLFYSVVRLIISASYLEKLKQRGHRVGDAVERLIEEVATHLQMKHRPQTRLSDNLEVPLVYGLTSGVLLLPRAFENWSDDQQRAVLMHELLHIRRRDMASELLSRLMRACYWFHPAAWYVSSQVTITRELATDQEVVRAGWDRCKYASGLLQVLEQLGRNHHYQPGKPPAVAMSGFAGIERRLKWVLSTSPVQIPKTRGGLLVLTLLILTLLTTIEFRWSMAEDQDPPNVAASNENEPPKHGDNDLIQRIRSSRVAEVKGDEYEAEFTISGQVFSADGNPVVGAIVVVRESSAARLTAQWTANPNGDSHDLMRINDVFAKVETDVDGKFVIRAARAPAMPKTWKNNWVGEIVAGHPDWGMGRAELAGRNEIVHAIDGVAIQLEETGSIEGRYLTPSGEPLANRMVRVFSLEPAFATDRNLNARIDLDASQLTPRALTDENGRFEFFGLPAGHIASVSAESENDWLGNYVAVATSTDIPLGEPSEKFNRTRIRTRGQKVVGTPFVLMADPGIHFRGLVVDDRRLPVPDVAVQFAAFGKSVLTNEAGEFDLHLPSNAQASGGGNDLFLRPKNPQFLSTTYRLKPTELARPEGIVVQLMRGHKVMGKVVDSEGKPCQGVSVFSDLTTWNAPSTVTNESGEYEFFLNLGTYQIRFAADTPGYRLPTTVELRQQHPRIDESVPKVMVKVTSNNLTNAPNAVVARSAKRQVQVLLPNGAPAYRASLVVVDPTQTLNPGVKITMTNIEGRATVQPMGVGNSEFVIEAGYSDGEKSYSGQVNFGKIDFDSSTIPLLIRLQEDWLVRGRVLINGEPVAGAVVGVGETTPNQGDRDNLVFSGKKRTSNFRRSTSGQDGRWEVKVRAGRQYGAMLFDVPGIETSHAAILIPQQIAAKVLEVPDFNFNTGNEEIAGIVVDFEGKPIEGARVSIHRSPNVNPHNLVNHQESSQFTTDELGRFALRCVPPGLYELKVSRSRMERSVPLLVEARAGEADLRITVDSRPLPEVPKLTARTVIDLPVPNEHPINPLANNSSDVSQSKTDRSEIKNPVEIRGVVVDSNDHPIAGAAVSSRYIQASSGGRISIFSSHSQATKDTITDSRGQFTILAGDVISLITLVVQADGFAPSQVFWERGTQGDFRVQLVRGAAISGRLMGVDGPVTGAKLGLIQADQTFGKLITPSEQITDSNGGFEFRNLPPDVIYTICTSHDQEITGVLPVSLVTAPEAGKKVDLGEILAETPRKFSVNVQTIDGSPLPDDVQIFVSRGMAYRGTRLEVNPDQQSSSTVTLASVGKEILEISVLASGYEPIRTLPAITHDLNKRYRIRFPEHQHLNIILEPKQAKSH